MVRDTATQADIIATNCSAAVRFEDRGAAEEMLATLRDKPQIVAARIYDIKHRGRILANYVRSKHDSDLLPIRPDGKDHQFIQGCLF